MKKKQSFLDKSYDFLESEIGQKLMALSLPLIQGVDLAAHVFAIGQELADDLKLRLGGKSADGSAPAADMVGDGITRFVAGGVDLDSLPPSFALVEKPKVAGLVPSSWRVVDKSQPIVDVFVSAHR